LSGVQLVGATSYLRSLFVAGSLAKKMAEAERAAAKALVSKSARPDY